MNARQVKTTCLSYLLFPLFSLFCPIYAKYNDTSHDYLYYGADNVTAKKLSKLKATYAASNNIDSSSSSAIEHVIDAQNTNAKTMNEEDDAEISLLYNNSDVSLYLDAMNNNSTAIEESMPSCYDNLKTLNSDMYTEALTQLNENDNADQEHIYIICPNTIINIPDKPSEDELALIPTLSNTKIQCGENGDMDNRCIVNGGIYQVLFHPKIVVQNVKFIGLQFVNNANGVSVAGWGHPLSSAFFYNCRWFVSLSKIYLS